MSTERHSWFARVFYRLDVKNQCKDWTTAIHQRVFFLLERQKTTPTKMSCYTPNSARRQCIKMPTYLDGTLRLLRIRNPWGKKRMGRAFSSGSDAWTSKLRSILKMTNKNDGTFWITYTDFMRRFSNIDVVKAHKDWYNVTFYSLPSKSILDFVDSSVIEIRVHEVTWVQICYFLPHSRGDSTDYFTSYKDVTIVLTKTTANGSPTQVEEVKVLKSNSTCRHQEHLEAILDDTNATYRLYFVRYSKEYIVHIRAEYLVRILFHPGKLSRVLKKRRVFIEF